MYRISEANVGLQLTNVGIARATSARDQKEDYVGDYIRYVGNVSNKKKKARRGKSW